MSRICPPDSAGQLNAPPGNLVRPLTTAAILATVAGSVTVKARSRRSARAAGLKPKTGSRSALWRPAGSVRLPDGQAARRPEHPPGSRSGSRIGRPAPPARAGSARPARRAARTRWSTTLTLAPGAGRTGTPRAGGTGTCAAQLRAGRLAPAAGQDDRGARDGGQQAWQPTRERPTADQPTAERPATERPTAERPATDGHAPLTQPGPRLVANRGLAWLIGALRLFGGSRMHRISLITRIHHVIRADLMPLRCMIPMGCRRRCVNGAPLRCNGARTPGRARLAYPQEATLCDSVLARGARGRRPVFLGGFGLAGGLGAPWGLLHIRVSRIPGIIAGRICLWHTSSSQLTVTARCFCPITCSTGYRRVMLSGS